MTSAFIFAIAFTVGISALCSVLEAMILSTTTAEIEGLKKHHPKRGEKLEKYKSAPFRAPMIIVLVSQIKEHKSVPEIEQIISTGTSAHGILLALNAMNYSGIWRTGIFAFNQKVGELMGLKENEKVIGYLYVGTPTNSPKKLDPVDTADYVTKWA